MTTNNSKDYKRRVENECSNKLTTAKTTTKKRKGWDMGQNRCYSGESKLKSMRKDLIDANKIMKSIATSGPRKVHETSAFGAAVAGMKIEKKKNRWDGQNRGLKRDSNLGLIFGNGVSKRGINLGGGKKLKLPRARKNA